MKLIDLCEVATPMLRDQPEMTVRVQQQVAKAGLSLMQPPAPVYVAERQALWR
jgi:hypothetical protein